LTTGDFMREWNDEISLFQVLVGILEQQAMTTHNHRKHKIPLKNNLTVQGILSATMYVGRGTTC